MAIWDIFSGRVGGGPDIADVNPNLLAAVRYGGTQLPPGYRMQIIEGYNPSGHVPGSQHHIKGLGALDVQIYGPNGQAISNRGEDTTGLYGQLAKSAYGYLAQSNPALASRFAWGGSFGTGRGSNVRDLMHFDLGGPRGNLGPSAQALSSGYTPQTGQGGVLRSGVALDAGGGGTIRWNNPGNIRASSWTASLPGYTGENNGFAVFDTIEHGNAAMSALLDKYAAGGANTVSSIISKWAPSNENDTARYIENVAKHMGVDPNAPLTPADRAKLMEAITIQEHGHTATGDAVASTGGQSTTDTGGQGDTTIPPPPQDTDLASLFGGDQSQEGMANTINAGQGVYGGDTYGSEQPQGTFQTAPATDAPQNIAAPYTMHEALRRGMTTPLGQLFSIKTIGQPQLFKPPSQQRPPVNPYAPG